MYKTDEEINQWGEQLQQARKAKGVAGEKEHLTKAMPGNWMKEATATIMGGLGAKFFMRKALTQAETKFPAVNATEVSQALKRPYGTRTIEPKARLNEAEKKAERE